MQLKEGGQMIKRQLKPGRYSISREDIFKMLTVSNQFRDTALIGLMGLAGLRREECIKLMIRNINLSMKRITVVGKGNKIRQIPLDPTLSSILEQYISQKFVKGQQLLTWENPISIFADDKTKDQRLFPSKIGLGHINLITVNRAVAIAGERAGLKNPDPTKKNINPHLLRHSYAHYLKSKKISLEIIRDVLGHESISTTADTYGLASFDEIQKELESIS